MCIRDRARRTVVAASQSTELLAGLQVDTQRMADNADAASVSLLAEQATVAEQLGGDPVDSPSAYLGATSELVDAVLERYRGGTS
jgi:3-carboxy-cis,cis-muconate cycloisomerase